MTAKPFLRWVGGKASFAKQMSPAIKLMTQSRAYIEPFLGGGAMFFAVEPEYAILNDINPELVSTYKAIKEDPSRVSADLEELREFGIDEESYYSIRGLEIDDGFARAAQFIYLNKLCFNGLYRVNSSGKYNVAYGKLKKPVIPTLDELEAVAAALEQSAVLNHDAIELIDSAKKVDFLYVDPPYDGTYTGYSKEGFCELSQERLAEALYNANERGVKFIAHNADTEAIRLMYESWCDVMAWEESHTVAVKSSSRKKLPCLVISNI